MDIQKVTKLEELVSSFRAKYNEITNGETENVGVVLSLQVDCNEDNKVHVLVFASGTPGDQGLAVKYLDDETGIVDTYVKCMALKSLKDLTGNLFGGKKRSARVFNEQADEKRRTWRITQETYGLETFLAVRFRQ